MKSKLCYTCNHCKALFRGAGYKYRFKSDPLYCGLKQDITKKFNTCTEWQKQTTATIKLTKKCFDNAKDDLNTISKYLT